MTLSIIADLFEASELLEILRHGKEITMNAIGSPDVVITRTVYTGKRAAWFRDSEGYLLGIGQPIS